MELYSLKQEAAGGPWVFRVNGQVKETGEKDMVFAYAYGYLTQHIYSMQGKAVA